MAIGKTGLLLMMMTGNPLFALLGGRRRRRRRRRSRGRRQTVNVNVRRRR